eukprot:CAMPEP_0184693112 /NCGR_PEP_ID=MMETSP0313-20130426/1404_1 /TAXON_ID=2792 /ORGANISM="Porphyridium aerugineum, Strain SAG 1380-2" /LENGTH=697 /DNA_ID=CAMNT_0027151081 /DNA_START=161 /DNA_END=2254 /DNA_ORIENTATION=-
MENGGIGVVNPSGENGNQAPVSGTVATDERVTALVNKHMSSAELVLKRRELLMKLREIDDKRADLVKKSLEAIQAGLKNKGIGVGANGTNGTAVPERRGRGRPKGSFKKKPFGRGRPRGPPIVIDITEVNDKADALGQTLRSPNAVGDDGKPRTSPRVPRGRPGRPPGSAELRKGSVMEIPADRHLRSFTRTPRYQFCWRLIRDMLKNPDAGPFAAPITELWSVDSLPGYFDVVKKPMDLRTIRNNMENGSYLKAIGSKPEANGETAPQTSNVISTEGQADRNEALKVASTTLSSDVVPKKPADETPLVPAPAPSPSPSDAPLAALVTDAPNDVPIQEEPLASTTATVAGTSSPAPGGGSASEQTKVIYDHNAFADDVRLVFTNAMLYNHPGDLFYERARSLLQDFERRFAELPSEEADVDHKKRSRASRKFEEHDMLSIRRRNKTRFPRSTTIELDGPTRSSRSRRKRRDVELTVEQLHERIELLRSQKMTLELEAKPSLPARSPRNKTLQVVSNEPMTFEEKKLLADNINRLPPDRLGRLVQIASKRAGQAEVNQNSEIEFDIAKLDTPTLREMEAYVNNAIARARGGLKNKTLPEVIKELETCEQLLKEKKVTQGGDAVAASSPATVTRNEAATKAVPSAGYTLYSESDSGSTASYTSDSDSDSSGDSDSDSDSSSSGSSGSSGSTASASSEGS